MIQLGMPCPELQFEVRNPEGRFVARTDFAWPSANVLGEVDGRVRYSGELPDAGDPASVIMAEKRREWLLRDLGYHVVRWDWATLHDPDVLARRILTALDLISR